jgi:acyl-CoA thioesterase FadM
MLNREEVLARSNVDYVFVDLQTGHHIIPSEELIEKLKV